MRDVDNNDHLEAVLINTAVFIKLNNQEQSLMTKEEHPSKLNAQDVIKQIVQYSN